MSSRKKIEKACKLQTKAIANINISVTFVRILKLNAVKTLVSNLKESFASFEKDAVAHVENGNKAAGTRARKASLAIEKSLKEFRKKSVEASKN
jgi:hypothetical protein